jgi:hypothetical protein
MFVPFSVPVFGTTFEIMSDSGRMSIFGQKVRLRKLLFR